jgi:hypothetical protein
MPKTVRTVPLIVPHSMGQITVQNSNRIYQLRNKYFQFVRIS